MSVTLIKTELDVLNKYNSLVRESLDVDSMYIRTKETLQELFEQGKIKDTDRAKVIADVMTGLNNSLVGASMATALDWAKSEINLALQKEELEKQLAILDAEISLKAKDLLLKDKDLLLKDKEIALLEAQRDNAYYDNIAKQAMTIRTYGTPTVDTSGAVTGLADGGKIYADIQLVEKNIENAEKEGVLLDDKHKESQAVVHKIIADTYTNYGALTYGISDTGLTVSNKTSTYAPGGLTLSDRQATIAEEQAKGYAYNAWANAMTGSASFLATALASEASGSLGFDTGGPGEIAMDNILGAATKLNAVTAA